MINNMNRNMYYAGHIMRNTLGHCDTLLRTIERKMRLRRTWVDDLSDWTGTKQYDQTNTKESN